MHAWHSISHSLHHGQSLNYLRVSDEYHGIGGTLTTYAHMRDNCMPHATTQMLGMGYP